jgi:hypothetical protein
MRCPLLFGGPLKDFLLFTSLRAAAIVTVAGLLAGCSGGGGSTPQAGTSDLGAPVQSVAQLPAESAYPDYVASLDAVPEASDVACTSKAKPSTKTVTLPAAGGTVTIPKYASFTGGATVPSSQPSGTMVTIKDSSNNFDKQTIPAGQKGVFFTSLELSQSVQFSSNTITSDVKSKCLTNGATYTINVYAFGGPLQAQAKAKAAKGELKFAVSLAGTNGAFPGGVTADIVISK